MDWLESYEVRWFFAPEHPVVEDLRQWFGDVPIEHDDRKDHYYFDQRRPDLNAKDRTTGKGSKLEFKYRAGTLGPTHFAPGVVGDLERWVKLSLKLDDDTIEAFPLSVAVQKARRLRKFEYSHGDVTEVPAEKKVMAGCGVEFTAIAASRHAQVEHAVTLGLEAFGPPEAALAALQSTAHQVFQERPALELGAANACSYSTWLIKTFRSGAR
ncbi:MAG TPA: hypothetical protein VFQ35_17495 [Polyangiaceae bacterium]|nr:hypothetical protein [Polyangiaceae bacterium]